MSTDEINSLETRSVHLGGRTGHFFVVLRRLQAMPVLSVDLGSVLANTNGNNWSNTLVLVTGDHDHLLLGPDSDTVPFQNLVDKGKGRLPGYKWQHTGHSNQLVPIYARGAGAQLLLTCAKRQDTYTDAQGRKFGRGAYLDQTEIFSVMMGRGCQ